MFDAHLETPAKINLFLAIRGRRDDGYHEIDTLFVPLSLSDRVRVTEGREGIVLVVEPAILPTDSRNLVWKAARRCLEGVGLRGGVSIAVTKRIPIAAGLGGGSSDAAATIRLFCRRFPELSGKARGIAASLGADVPYFLDPRPAWFRGRGDRCVRPVALACPIELLLVRPRGRQFETGEIYRRFDGHPPSPPGRLEALIAAMERGDLAGICAHLHNDLTRATEGIYAERRAIEAALRRHGALGTGMSGSGPMIFGIFPDPASADRAAAALPRSWERLRTAALPV
ncbi:MAG: 4-(cytidine 5'-diphospho)-2-C-methyl-D-erythritol kinase [Deltaproteobacteria bacterium]|nr:MAG: 4-(cytidine 5'-diphospho)-2-C-methyl-D-erythritol kinase [Deltaproteobacteria bacterium]